MRGSTRPALPAFIFGSTTLVSLLAASVCQGAVVRALHSRSDAGATEVQIECEADGPVHGRSEMLPGGLRYVVEISSATLGKQVERVAAIDDSRVRSVTVVADDDSGSVRLEFDLAKKVDANLQTLENPSRVRIRFSDAARGDGARKNSARGEGGRKSSRSPGVRKDPHGDSAAAGAAGAGTTGADRTAAGAAAALPAEENDRSPALPAPASRDVVLARRLILLDPGHGGKDPGAQAWHGQWEKEIVLDLARRVADRLRRRLGVEVLMTRNEDTFVSLADRRAMAARWGADLFVSIHANASANMMASGIETYYHCGPSAERRRGVDPATRRLARAENGPRARRPAAARPVRTSVRQLPLQLQEDSKRLASSIQRELVRNLGMRYDAVRDLGVKEGPFFVLEDIDVPSVLVEAAFLTHRAEGLRIHSSVYREQVAEGIFRGIERYLDGQAKPGTL